MEKSGGIYLKLLAIVVGFTLISISMGIGSYVGSLYSPHNGDQSSESSNRATGSEKRDPDQIARDRPGLPYFVERIASAPDPQNADEREKRDLAAQEASALWGFWMLVISATGTAVGIVGTGFLLWQIILTRAAVEENSEATKAMVHANKIAEASQRPYLHIEEMGWRRGDLSDRFVFTLAVKNFGQTPARNFTAKADVRYSIKKQYPRIWSMTTCAASDIIPQNKVVNLLVECGDPRKNDQKSNLFAEDIFCRFELRYEDAFNNQYAVFETYRLGRFKNGSDGTYRFFSSP